MSFEQDFGCHVFRDEVMKSMLPSEVFVSLQRTRKAGGKLDEAIAGSGGGGNAQMGASTGRNPLHSLVSADDRRGGRKE